MRTDFTISTLAHAALLAWAVLSFSTRPFEAKPVESLPVDIISDSDLSRIMAGTKTAPKAPAPKPLVEKVAETAKPVEDVTPKISERPEVKTASSETVPPKPPDPKPPEKKVEKKVDEIAEALKKEKVDKPPPPKKPPQPKLDMSKIENKLALLDKREQRRQAATGTVLNPTPSLGLPTATAAALSQSEIDALRSQIQACWNPPAGAMDARDIVVRVRLALNQDGSVAAVPRVTNTGANALFNIAAESAVRAIQRCQPYRLPIAKYEVWRDVEVTFDPREMYRG